MWISPPLVMRPNRLVLVEDLVWAPLTQWVSADLQVFGEPGQFSFLRSLLVQ